MQTQHHHQPDWWSPYSWLLWVNGSLATNQNIKQHLNGPINCKFKKNTAASKWISKSILNHSVKTVKTSDSVKDYKWELSDHFAADSELKLLNLMFKNCH